MKSIFKNLILNTDSYKLTHWNQYPKGTENVFSYVESRGCAFSDKIMMFGLQYFLQEYMSEPVTLDDVTQASAIAYAHGVPFNEDGWRYIVDYHKGMLPVRIRAVPEGTVIPTRSVMATIECTDPKCYWLVSYLETALLRAIWYPSTVATNSMLAKEIIKEYLDLTSDKPEEEIMFKLHDFGARGVSSMESAAIGGAAHLVNFMGSDTISGILFAMEYYKSGMCGFSIPAGEHSTYTSWGRENEEEAYRNMVENYAKEGALFAVVSDSYDIYNAVEKIWGEHLLPIVKEKKATVVIRPDSGDPVEVTLKVVQLLMEKAGYTINSKGYKVLPEHVRIIQGDGVNRDTIYAILRNFAAHKISASNIAFGMGGMLLQGLTRDTFKFAMKCSAVKVNGEWRDVYKDPITDPGKKSKKGLLTLVRTNDGAYLTVHPSQANGPGVAEVLQTVYDNGIVASAMTTFDEVRQRAAGLHMQKIPTKKQARA